MPFNRDLLMQEMAGPCPMYLMKIVHCTNVDAPAEIHCEAEPFLARTLTKEIRQMLLYEDTTADQTEGKANAAAITDDHSRVTYRGGIGFTVISPPMIKTGMANSNAVISFTSSTNIQYKVRYEEYGGRTIMKAKDKEVYAYGFGEVPPTALQHPENHEEAIRDSFKNALTLGGLKWHKVESRLNAANKVTNKILVEWKMPKWEHRGTFYKAMKVPLPSTDEGTIQFSGTFCKNFNLHMYCGHPNNDNGVCTNCGPSNGVKKIKKVNKRSFDDLFEDLN